MKNLIPIILLAFLSNLSFSQSDTTAIFHKADSLIKVGDSFYFDNKYLEAIDKYGQVAEITKNIDGRVNKLYAKMIYYIADAYYKYGDYRNSLKYYQQTVELRKSILGEEHLDYALALNNVGIVYSELHDYQNALKYKMQSMEIRKKILGENHPDYAASVNNVGTVYDELGDSKNALKYYFKAMEIRKKALGENCPEYAASLNNIAIVYNDMGDYKNALKYHTQAMEIRKKIFGDKDTEYAMSLNNIASVYDDMGDHQNALKYHTQAMEIRKMAHGEEHPDYAASLNNIGIAYSELGDFQNALKYKIQAMEIRKKVFGEDNPEYAASVNNVGTVYDDMRDYQNALKYYMQAMEIRKKALGEENPEYASSLNNIAGLYGDMGDYQNALKYYMQALEIKKKIYGEEHPSYATSLSNTGIIYDDMGDYQNALKYHAQSIEVKKKILGEEHPGYAASLNNIGIVYNNIGDNQKALKYHTQAMKIREKVYGKTHLSYAESLNNISLVYESLGDFANAVKMNKLATDIRKNLLIKNFSFMTTKEREAYWDAYNTYFSKNIGYMYHSPNDTLATKTSYDTELITKGLLLASEISIINTIAESKNKALISEYNEMKSMTLLLNKEQERPIEERVYNCDSLENEVRKMERHIMEKSKEFGDITNFIKINWKDVRNSLENNDVAIEFSNFTENDTTKFVALVLTKGMEAPVCVPLFNQYEMQKLQRGIAPAKIDTQTDDENRGATTVVAKRQGIYESTGLYKMLWKPLEKYFPENPRIYFAPSGILYQIAIEYAPIDSEKTISDKYEIYRVSSTRFLAMDYMPKPMKNSVLYGGVFYDSDTTTMKQESDRYSTRKANGQSVSGISRSVDREGLNYLPGTKTEVENIVGTLKKKKKVKSTLYEGSQANEESFKALSGNDISVLHIATHGFFLPTDEKMSGDQSLVQSGLLLSGANLAWQNQPIPEGVEDGILTAKEISFMDLRKTDLVVLSACQTALGEITGEGVFGLQRGFKKAGVRTIIMSLWPVDDNATLLMMTEFYTNLTKGMTKREAFLAAQNKVKTTEGFGNPRYWAAFIMLDGNEN